MLSFGLSLALDCSDFPYAGHANWTDLRPTFNTFEKPAGSASYELTIYPSAERENLKVFVNNRFPHFKACFTRLKPAALRLIVKPERSLPQEIKLNNIYVATYDKRTNWKRSFQGLARCKRYLWTLKVEKQLMDGTYEDRGNAFQVTFHFGPNLKKEPTFARELVRSNHGLMLRAPSSSQALVQLRSPEPNCQREVVKTLVKCGRINFEGNTGGATVSGLTPGQYSKTCNGRLVYSAGKSVTTRAFSIFPEEPRLTLDADKRLARLIVTPQSLLADAGLTFTVSIASKKNAEDVVVGRVGIDGIIFSDLTPGEQYNANLTIKSVNCSTNCQSVFHASAKTNPDFPTGAPLATNHSFVGNVVNLYWNIDQVQLNGEFQYLEAILEVQCVGHGADCCDGNEKRTNLTKNLITRFTDFSPYQYHVAQVRLCLQTCYCLVFFFQAWLHNEVGNSSASPQYGFWTPPRAPRADIVQVKAFSKSFQITIDRQCPFLGPFEVDVEIRIPSTHELIATNNTTVKFIAEVSHPMLSYVN